MGDFWKRWHISLSSWLKDHLCIPMGGNRGASVFTYICLVAVLIFLILISGTLWLGIVFLFGSLVIWLLARFFPGLKLTLSTHINLMMTMLLGFVLHQLPYVTKDRLLNRFVGTPMYAKILLSALVVLINYQSISD